MEELLVKTENLNDSLKSVANFLDGEHHFFIPSYQRGYRWTQVQVQDLLNDIEEYDKTKDGQFYCLQPLVVKKNGDKWNVIDGQQRLTTICLIIDYLKHERQIQLEYQRGNYIEEAKNASYEAKGEFKDIWVKYIESTPENNNVEFYHLLQAKYEIGKWFTAKDNKTKELMLIWNLLRLKKAASPIIKSMSAKTKTKTMLISKSTIRTMTIVN